MLHQKPSGNLARLKYLAALPVCAGLLCASTLAFSKTYGWIDLAPKPKNDTTYTNKTEHNSDYVNVNDFTNAKGYKIEEKTAAHNGNWRQKVTITDKDGKQHVYDNDTITPGERKMLSETYGYQFPKVKAIKVKLIPPAPKVPPVHPIKEKSPSAPKSEKADPNNAETEDARPAPPAPPVPPVPLVSPGKASDKIAPPQSPDQNLNDSDKIALKKEKIGYQQAKEPEDFPLVFINGKKYSFKEKRKPGQQFFCSATDSLVRYQPGTALALKKWGGEAKNGVILLYGKDASIEIK